MEKKVRSIEGKLSLKVFQGVETNVTISLVSD